MARGFSPTDLVALHARCGPRRVSTTSGARSTLASGADALGEEKRYALVKLAEPRREVDKLRVLIVELAGKPAAT